MSLVLKFTKLHGAGNDFILLEDLDRSLPPLEKIARRLCDRHFGIGADQLLVLRPSQHAHFRMDIYNADGGQVEMCANGIRAFYKYLRDHGHTKEDEIAVETLAGIVKPRWAGPGRVTVDMGPPILAPSEIPTALGEDPGPVLDVPLRIAGETLSVSCISMGNPHCVVYVPDVDKAPVAEWGPQIEHHPAFPKRVNVEFAEVVARDRLRQRTWERGTGETLACGSGACAVAVASALRGTIGSGVAIELRGGELEIEWRGPGESVWMTGPAAEVFSGRIALEED